MESKLLNTIKEAGIGKKFAVGNDLVFMPTFNDSLTDLFKKKVYTADETVYCEQFNNSLLRYASTWAAKEAVYKAVKQLSTDNLAWNKIEIMREKIAGQPTAMLHQYPGKYNISLTLSHDGDYVWAIAIIER
ncbi:MAG TPA: 4'-phosphopantetheinyl transferase superfamily protein [Mucilaginibacter sp.]